MPIVLLLLLQLIVLPNEESSIRLFFFDGPGANGCGLLPKRNVGEVVKESGLERNIRKTIEPVVNGMGFIVVEITVGISHQLEDVKVVVYRNEGVGINDLSLITRNIRPRLELMEELPNLALTVGSPGIDRVIISPEECVIFRGRGVRILLKEGSEWMKGTIAEYEDDLLSIQLGDEVKQIELDRIQKARLDD